MANPKPVVPLTPEQRQMVEDNIGIAVFNANVIRKWSLMEYDDLASVCMEGLCHAARAYDPGKGYAFSSFASRCIRNWHDKQQKTYIRKNKIIYVDLPEGKDGLGWEEYLNIGDRPLDDQIASSVDIHRAVLDANLLDSEKKVLARKIANPDILQREIAEALGVTQQCVFTTLNRARNKIRAQLAV